MSDESYVAKKLKEYIESHGYLPKEIPILNEVFVMADVEVNIGGLFERSLREFKIRYEKRKP